MVGLAVASELVEVLPSVLLLERNEGLGEETSSRNSEVIHSGIYYPCDSLKTRLCCRGRELLYQFCDTKRVPYRNTAKLIVSTTSQEDEGLEELRERARKSELRGVEILTRQECKAMESEVSCRAALLVPQSGIVDSHSLMARLAASIRGGGGDMALGTTLLCAEVLGDGFSLLVRDQYEQEYSFTSRWVVNAAGLQSDRVASLFGIDPDEACYRLHYAKGSYFGYSGPPLKLERLIYPCPDPSSLGIHLVLDLGGQCRFGPDLEYLNSRCIDYSVDPGKRWDFHRAITRYLPQIDEKYLHPAFSGIRPKLASKDEGFRDFVIVREDSRSLAQLINLIGIDSPGLTSSLAIAERVKNMMDLQS